MATADLTVSVERKITAIPDGNGRWVSVERYDAEMHPFTPSVVGGCSRCGGEEWEVTNEGRLHPRYVQTPTPFISHTAALAKIKALIGESSGGWLVSAVKEILEEAGL